MKQINLFMSYYYDEAREYMETLADYLESNYEKINVIYEKTNYRHKGLSDSAITKIIRENYLRISNFVIVLVSKNAWRRKHVDWEISAALRNSKTNKRKPIIAVFTPDYGNQIHFQTNKTPYRLIDNINSGYVEYIFWNEIGEINFLDLLHSAQESSRTYQVINNQPLRRKNNEKE